MSEVQLQRKELERLLQTAKDKDRQELLKNAIASLDEVTVIGDSLSSIHPAMRSSLLDDLISNTSLEVAPTSSAPQLMNKIRPLSAQPRRRLSFGNLAAIPENRSLLASSVERHQQVRNSRLSQGMFMGGGGGSPSSSGYGGGDSSSLMGGNRPMKRSTLLDSASSSDVRRSRSGDMNEVIVVGASDVRYVVGSSHDPRRPPIGVFRSYTSSSSSGGPNSFNAGGFNLRDSAIDENSDSLRYIERAVATRMHGTHSSSAHRTGGSARWVSTGLMPQFLTIKLHERWLILGISICCHAVDALEAVITDDELGEYYEGDGVDSASSRHAHHFGTSTLVVNGVKQPRGDATNASSSVFVCDLDTVCQSHHDRAPQMVVRRRDSGHRDIVGHAVVGSDGDGADPKDRSAFTTYGIVGTKVQIKFLRATDSFIRVSEIEIKAQSY